MAADDSRHREPDEEDAVLPCGICDDCARILPRNTRRDSAARKVAALFAAANREPPAASGRTPLTTHAFRFSTRLARPAAFQKAGPTVLRSLHRRADGVFCVRRDRTAAGAAAALVTGLPIFPKTGVRFSGCWNIESLVIDTRNWTRAVPRYVVLGFAAITVHLKESPAFSR